jgi:hypothetical protein
VVVPRCILERFTIFLILFGSGIAPLPTTTPESFATRIGCVLLAVGYTLCVRAAGVAPSADRRSPVLFRSDPA